MGGKFKNPDFIEKIGGTNFLNATFGSDFTKNREFAAAHSDAPPPAKGQSYGDFTKAYGDAHPVKTEPAQGLPAPSASPSTSASVTPAVQQPTAYSAPQGITNASVLKAPGAAAAPVSPAATTQSPRMSPQAAQVSQGPQAARAANQMTATPPEVKQFQVPNLGQISFGGS